MTRNETIKEVCLIVNLAYSSINDYSSPSDCFCQDIPGYQNSGLAIDYVRKAVLNQLKRDNIVIHPRFDPLTGNEKLGG